MCDQQLNARKELVNGWQTNKQGAALVDALKKKKRELPSMPQRAQIHGKRNLNLEGLSPNNKEPPATTKPFNKQSPK